MPNPWDQDEVVKPTTNSAAPWESDAPAHTTALPSLVPGTPNSDAAGRFVGGVVNAINPIPGIRQMATEATDPNIGLRSTLGSHLVQPQLDQFKKAGDAFAGRGTETEGMGLPGRISTGIGHGMAGVLPLVGPPAADAAEQIGSGDVAGGLGSAAGLGLTLAAPDMVRTAGRGLMRAAEPLAENAMGIRNVDRKFGRTPGRAILDLTNGVRPGAVSESAGDVIGAKSAQRNGILAASPNQVDFAPALTEGRKAMNTAAAGNSDTGHLQPMIEQLTLPKPGFTGNTAPINAPVLGTAGPSGPVRISLSQDPLNALAMRQRFGNDFTKFDAARPLSREALNVGNKVYGKITDAIHSAVPESAPLDRDISNLIPVRDAGAARELNAGPLQRVAGRFGAHTGALIGGLEGARLAGLPGAIAGIAGPELIADPTTQMIAARGINGTGRVASSPLVSPGISPLSRPTIMPVGRSIQALPLVTRPKQ